MQSGYRAFSEPAPKFTVDFHQYAHDNIELEVTTEAPGLLVMSELYTPDWTVQVDGQSAELLRANYAFRAVYIPAGNHNVTFSYRPWAFAAGCGLTILGLFILSAGILISIHCAKSQTYA